MIYKFLSYIWRNTLLKWYRDSKKNKYIKHWQEHRVRNGKQNPDKTFYIIRRQDDYCGLCSILLTTLKRIDICEKNGYIPIVDMQNDFNIYLSSDEIGKINAWEYYFEQPKSYTLNDAGRSANVIVGNGAVPDNMFPYLDVNFLYGKTGELEYWRKLARDNFKLSHEAKEILDKEYSRLFDANDRILGVKLRGTDYVSGKPKNHPIQPTAEQAVEQVERIFEEQKCTKIFLATEDEKIYELFKSKFNDKLVTNKTDYLHYNGGSIGREEYEAGNLAKAQGMEYLITTMLLTKCNCLCAGCVSGTVIALLLTEGYDYTYLFDLGIY